MDPVELSTTLKVYGPLGILALLTTFAAIKLYRDRDRDRQAFEAERKEWDKEMRTLEERYVTKAETWMSKYAEFSQAATQVVDATIRRFGGERGRSQGDTD